MLPECQLKTLNQLVIDEITITEVKDIIHSIDINKASGPDNISNRMLKGVLTLYVNHFAYNSIVPSRKGFSLSLGKKQLSHLYLKKVISLCRLITDPSLC